MGNTRDRSRSRLAKLDSRPIILLDIFLSHESLVSSVHASFGAKMADTRLALASLW